MEVLKYKVIKSEDQYFSYCKILEDLVDLNDNRVQDEVDLLILLIEKWDEAHNTFKALNPVELLLAFMDDHGLRSKDMVRILGLSKGTVSKILNYQKGLSKQTIRKLSNYFKVSQEAFNRPYELVGRKNQVFLASE